MARARKVFELPNAAFPITLFQTGKDRFSVSYGAQYNADLRYAEAAAALGAAIMHAAACDGKLRNEEEE